MKVAGAPISWGVSELAGWGYRMAPDRVLGEMHELGLQATELGPPGYLPHEPGALRDLLRGYGLSLAAGFLAVVLHERARRAAAMAEVQRQARALAGAEADVLVLAAALPGDTYDRRESLPKAEWAVLAESLAEVADVTMAHGLELAVHPHAGTAVSNANDVIRLLETTDVAICIDTGHLYLGGSDPAQVVTAAGSRVRHVHLKDIDSGLAARVRSGTLTYAQAVRSGLYRPLGSGDLDIVTFIQRLNQAHYEGWYVLEQDMALTAEPGPNEGPDVAARQSLDFFTNQIERRADVNRSTGGKKR